MSKKSPLIALNLNGWLINELFW